MAGIDLTASVNNITQLDRHQEQSHRVPVENQMQNSDAEAQEARQRTVRAVEPDTIKGKTIDPDDKRREDERKRRKKERADQRKGKNSRGPSGHFVDIDA